MRDGSRGQRAQRDRGRRHDPVPIGEQHERDLQRQRRRNVRGFEILSPSPGVALDEGDSIAFLADVSGSSTSPDDVVVQWTYERLDGVPVTFGTMDLGESLTATPFCDGTWAVTVSFDGSGTGGTGGALSGADLRWESRKQGAPTWTDQGTGTTDINTISITVQRPPD